ncbi:hypothetical protein A4A49_61895 [Nicotiana attenuata]|uniref:Uncharacterized protein n=1 Tax=Nicotiana attenuata TaxID=49451 RepID=A0A314L0U9_NICAT|nr:hypothetical protein A4A49_61895 [Nicotiana attenuata]
MKKMKQIQKQEQKICNKMHIHAYGRSSKKDYNIISIINYNYFLVSLFLLYLTLNQLALTLAPSLTFPIPAEAAIFVFSIPTSNFSLTLRESFGLLPSRFGSAG